MDRTSRATVWLTFAAMVGPSASRAADLTAGMAEVEITPPVGYRLSGYFVERQSTGVHDPLKAKALVLAQGDVKAAFIFCDLIAVPRSVSDPARGLVAARTGIPAAGIVITGTHTHTGPLFYGPLRKHFHEQAVAKYGKDPCEIVDYPAQLIEKIGEVASRAAESASSVVLEATTTEQDPPLSFNRRFHMKDGSVRFNPGQKNPDIVRAAGPIDPQVGIVLLKAAQDRKLKACLTVFALHLDTTGGTLYSADYPFYLEKKLQASLGGDLMSFFGTGTCGDVNHIDVSITGRRTAEEIGESLAATVIALVAKARPVEASPLAVKTRTVHAPKQQYTQQQQAQAARDVALVGTGKLPFLREVEACKIVDLARFPGTTIPLEVQAFRLGRDLAVVTLPGEVFVEFGLAIKKASPFRTTLVVELANDVPAYIPTRQAFAEGSYETVNSRVQPGGGEMMVNAAIEILQELAG
ncbi:MAG: neutral/alkaline non-lysosomal ceramidase N-terminal domain-containing protein [Phycisphaerae bacterium]